MTYSDEEFMRRLRAGEDSGWEFRRVECSQPGNSLNCRPVD